AGRLARRPLRGDNRSSRSGRDAPIGAGETPALLSKPHSPYAVHCLNVRSTKSNRSNRMKRLVAALGLMVMFLSGGAAMAADTSSENQMPSVTTVPEAARPSANFDVDKATDAYLA